MDKAYLLLGSNEGDRVDWLSQAINLLQESCGEIQQKSPIYQTAAWGVEEQPDFLNMAIEIATPHTPYKLLQEINQIEEKLGRQRVLKWGQRTLDIDILLFGNIYTDSEQLTIPHKYLHERKFALVPLNDIAGAYRHPILNKTINQLLIDCEDDLEVTLFATKL